MKEKRNNDKSLTSLTSVLPGTIALAGTLRDRQYQLQCQLLAPLFVHNSFPFFSITIFSFYLAFFIAQPNYGNCVVNQKEK